MDFRRIKVQKEGPSRGETQIQRELRLLPRPSLSLIFRNKMDFMGIERGRKELSHRLAMERSTHGQHRY